MKKLLIAAASLSVAASAFAVTVYDYKASVKYVDMKKVSVKVDGQSTQLLIKQVKSASLTGYLVNADCCGYVGPLYGYLVVANKAASADKGVPKILPADLMAKMWWTKEAATTGEAQGYLFAGKGKYDNPYTYNADVNFPNAYAGSEGPFYAFGQETSFGTRFLFGMYNDSTRLPVVDTDGNVVITYKFFDAWLDASGFGKATNVGPNQSGCSLGTAGYACLDSLSGSVIGGLYICYGNGSPLTPDWETVLCATWEGTTDVITGTWSIKRTSKVLPQDLTVAEAASVPADRLVLFPYVKGAANMIKAGDRKSVV